MGIACGGAFVRHLQASVACQFFNRFNITESGVFHDEADRRAMCAATKAMVELLGLADGKGGGFFVVKRTAGDKICPGFFQRDIALNHVHDVEAVKQILNKTFWNQARTFHRCRQSAGGMVNRVYLLSCAFINAETLPMSARPASLGLSRPITLPMSCGPDAPVAAIASATAEAISASPSCCGM